MERLSRGKNIIRRWNSSYQTLDVTRVVMTSNSAQTRIMQNLTVSVVNNTRNCLPNSVQHDLHLGATKPGRKSTISSINSKLNSPVYNLSLNPYPMQFQSYTKIRVPTHSPSITSVILKTLWSHTSNTTLDYASQLKSRYTALTLKSFEWHNTYNSMNTLCQSYHLLDNGLAYKIRLILDSQNTTVKYDGHTKSSRLKIPETEWRNAFLFILQHLGFCTCIFLNLRSHKFPQIQHLGC